MNFDQNGDYVTVYAPMGTKELNFPIPEVQESIIPIIKALRYRAICHIILFPAL